MNRWRTMVAAACISIPGMPVGGAVAATVQSPPTVAASSVVPRAKPATSASAVAPDVTVRQVNPVADGTLAVVAEPSVIGQPGLQSAPPALAGAQGTDELEASRTWLRRSSNAGTVAPVDDTQGFPFGSIAIVIVAGLVAGAMILRRRRGKSVPWMPASPVRVLSTTRIGPKASLVTVDVHGRVLLLGVTEETVSELGWVESALETKADDQSELAEHESRRYASEPTRDARSGFNQVFSSMFGNAERSAKDRTFRGNPEVAALIAARETRDTVTTGAYRASHAAERRSSGGARAAEPEATRVETQVAGLMRRRR